MAFSEKLAERIRDRFSALKKVQEKPMMGGLTFMYNGKMCVGVFNDDLMCRIDKAFHNEAIEKKGCRTMDFSNRPMIGYVLVDERGMKSKKDFDYWIDLSIEFNKKAKASRKPVKKKSIARAKTKKSP